MTSHNLDRIYKKYLSRFSRVFSSILDESYHRILLMEYYERYFVIGLIVTFLLALCSPLMILSPNDGADSSYIFLLNLQLLKTMIVVLGPIGFAISWHISVRVKNYVIEYIGFEKNIYLLSLLLLFWSTASIISLWEMNSILTDYTTMLKMHTMYYVIQIMFISLIAYCFYLLSYQAQGWFKGHVMWYSPKNRSENHDDMQWLFENLKE